MPIMIWLPLSFVVFNFCSGTAKEDLVLLQWNLAWFINHLFLSAGSPSVNQPQSTSVPLGQDIQIACRGDNMDAKLQQWFQQQPGKTPKLIIYSGATRPAGISERYSGSVSGNTAVLSIARAQAEDEAIYHCLLRWDGIYHWPQ